MVVLHLEPVSVDRSSSVGRLSRANSCQSESYTKWKALETVPASVSATSFLNPWEILVPGTRIIACSIYMPCRLSSY